MKDNADNLDHSSESVMYRGQPVKGFNWKGGFPYVGMESVFDKVRHRPDFKLDNYTVRDLEAEMHGYIVRYNYHRRAPQNLRAALADFDRARAICNFIVRTAISEDVRKGRLLDLRMMNIHAATVLADFAVEQGNYPWARSILHEAIARLEEERTSGDDSINYDQALHDMKEALRHVDLREKNFPGSEDLVPLVTPHEMSLASMLKVCQEAEQYEEAARLKRRADEIVLSLEGACSLFVILVARKLLLEHLPPDTRVTVRQGRVELFRPHRLAYIREDMSRGSYTVGVYNREMHARVLGVLHSDEIVFEFGRFAARVRKYYKG